MYGYLTFTDLMRYITANKQDMFPFYNEYVVKEGEREFYLIEVALAGYPKENVRVKLDNNTRILRIEADAYKRGDVVANQVHGIANRKCSREWTIPVGFKVDRVKFENGILEIWLDYSERAKAIEEFSF